MKYFVLLSAFAMLRSVSCFAQGDVQSGVSNVLRAESGFYGSDSTSIAVKSAKIDGEFYTVIYRSDEKLLYVVSDKRDIILKQEGVNSRFNFYDFNDDSYQDIIFDYNYGKDSIRGALLYDYKKQNFREVKGLKNFPSARKIMNSDCYYSHTTSGCAGMDWISQLFYINKKNRAVKLATMVVNQCPNSANGGGIFIRKEKSRRLKPETVPLTEYTQHPGSKDNFLHSYWQRNIERFR